MSWRNTPAQTRQQMLSSWMACRGSARRVARTLRAPDNRASGPGIGRGNGDDVVGSHRLLPVPTAGAGASGTRAASDGRPAPASMRPINRLPAHASPAMYTTTALPITTRRHSSSMIAPLSHGLSRAPMFIVHISGSRPRHPGHFRDPVAVDMPVHKATHLPEETARESSHLDGYWSVVSGQPGQTLTSGLTSTSRRGSSLGIDPWEPTVRRPDARALGRAETPPTS